MKKSVLAYGIAAFILVAGSVLWFIASLSGALRDGTAEAERSFSWISRETVRSSLDNGFLSARFIEDLESLCGKSRLLEALMIETPAGVVYVWPENSRFITIGLDGKPSIASSDIIRRVFSSALDIGDSQAGSVRMTAVINVLQNGAVFSASRNSFMLVLAVLLVTLIVLILQKPEPAASGRDISLSPDSEFSLEDCLQRDHGIHGHEPESPEADSHTVTAVTLEDALGETPESNDDRASEIRPEGLFSPVTGIGWEPYLEERLDAELVRAASSEQDLALLIVRVPGLMHTDLLSRKVASILLETISFRDMLFEFGRDGFAGIMQNVNLDLAMKTAEKLYARIDEMLLELSGDARIALGLTTRTARLLPAARMIQEAEAAVKKAEEEPNLPIVAFRANPEKYRTYVAENVSVT